MRNSHDCSGFVWPNSEPDWKFTVDDDLLKPIPLRDLHLLYKVCLRISNYPTDLAKARDADRYCRCRHEGWWRPGVDKRLCRLALQNVMHHYWPDRFEYTHHLLDGVIAFD